MMVFKEVQLTKQEGEIFTERQDWVLLPGADYVSPVFKLDPTAARPGAQLFGFMDAGFDGNIKVEAIIAGLADGSDYVAAVLDTTHGGSATGFTDSFLTSTEVRCIGIRFSVTGHTTSGGVITVYPHG